MIFHIHGVCSFSWIFDNFPVNSKKMGVQAPENCELKNSFYNFTFISLVLFLYVLPIYNIAMVICLNHQQNIIKVRGVLVLLKFWQFSSELTKTWSSGATECGVWIGNCNVKEWKSTEHKLHNIWRSLKFQQNEHTPGWTWVFDCEMKKNYWAQTHSLKFCKKFRKTSKPQVWTLWSIHTCYLLDVNYSLNLNNGFVLH